MSFSCFRYSIQSVIFQDAWWRPVLPFIRAGHGQLRKITLDILHLTFDTLHLTNNILHLTFEIKHPTLYTLHRTFEILHLTFCTLHLTFHFFTSDLWHITIEIWHILFINWHLYPLLSTWIPVSKERLKSAAFLLWTWHCKPTLNSLGSLKAPWMG